MQVHTSWSMQLHDSNLFCRTYLQTTPVLSKGGICKDFVGKRCGGRKRVFGCKVHMKIAGGESRHVARRSLRIILVNRISYVLVRWRGKVERRVVWWSCIKLANSAYVV